MDPITRNSIPQPKVGITLLDLARAAAKEQWSVGETSWIWGDKSKGAYLKNVNCQVKLFTTDNSKPGLVVFILMHTGWQEVEGLDHKYQAWKQEVNRVSPAVGLPKLATSEG